MVRVGTSYEATTNPRVSICRGSSHAPEHSSYSWFRGIDESGARTTPIGHPNPEIRSVSAGCRLPRYLAGKSASFLRFSGRMIALRGRSVLAPIHFVITATNPAAMRSPEVPGYPGPCVKQKTALRAGTPVLRTAYNTRPTQNGSDVSQTRFFLSSLRFSGVTKPQDRLDNDINNKPNPWQKELAKTRSASRIPPPGIAVQSAHSRPKGALNGYSRGQSKTVKSFRGGT